MGNSGQPIEIEAKYRAAAETLDRIAELRGLGDYVFEDRGQALLETTYLDTEDRALARARAALRLRRISGVSLELTLKLEGETDGALHRRPEWTVRLESDPKLPLRVSEGPLRARLEPLGASEGLRAILETRIDRRLRHVSRVDGQPFAELALDRVRFRAGDRDLGGLHEVEIEALSRDSSAEVVRFGALLAEGFALEPSRLSKLEEGLERLERRSLG